MSLSGEESEDHRNPSLEIDDDDDDDEEEYYDDDEEDDDDDETLLDESETQFNTSKAETLFRQIYSSNAPLRVNKIVINGNCKTKDSVIKSEFRALETATSLQELFQAASVAKDRMRQLELFDSVNITFDSGPSELSGTTNVIVDVVEDRKRLNCDFRVFSLPEAKSWPLEGSLKLKNLLGYGDLWDGSLAYGCDQMPEVSAGVSLPQFTGLFGPLKARVSLLSQDRLEFASFKEQSLGLSLGLLSNNNHDVACNFSLHTSIDPSEMSSTSIRGQLKHGLNSDLRYTFKIDKRNSPLRPTRGFAFVSASQFGGLVPDFRSSRFFRQEFDLRCAVPLGFFNAALNFGIASGVLFSQGTGFLNLPSYLPDRYFLGGNSSPVCTVGGPTSLLAFKSRGFVPTEPNTEARANDGTTENSSGKDYLGGDLAVTAFADLSFDLPLRFIREKGIYGHAFARAGSLNKMTEQSFQDMTSKKFLDSFRSSVGIGIIVPTRLFRMEVSHLSCNIHPLIYCSE
uniref:Bacterial surface antigen (D15) domain-containing protein n=1 Tax=Daucus carota subsp. sativus TaxID=79200 RepID=A0A161ZKP0_DAUCS